MLSIFQNILSGAGKKEKMKESHLSDVKRSFRVQRHGCFFFWPTISYFILVKHQILTKNLFFILLSLYFVFFYFVLFVLLAVLFICLLICLFVCLFLFYSLSFPFMSMPLLKNFSFLSPPVKKKKFSLFRLSIFIFTYFLSSLPRLSVPLHFLYIPCLISNFCFPFPSVLGMCVYIILALWLNYFYLQSYINSNWAAECNFLTS